MEREYYPLRKASELYKTDIEDLIHFGATGKLPIYIFANGLPNYVVLFYRNSTKPFEIYSAETDTTGICKLPLTGLNRLTPNCLQKFELDSDDNLATIDLNDTLKISTDETAIWVRPNPEVRLSLDNLFIMQDDIKLLTSVSSENDYHGVSKRSMLRLIHGLAVGGYRYDPSSKRNDKLADMKKDLDTCKVSLSDDTIRSILKEAADIPKDES